MSITSFYFLCLFALALVLYYVIPKKAQWAFLLLLSLGYFMTSDTVVQSGGWYVVFYLFSWPRWGFPFIPLPCWDICSMCIMRSGKSRKTTSASFCSEAISL